MTLLNKLSSFLILIGLFAIVMGFMDMVPKILSWIYLWGEIVAWIIKLSLVIGGALIWLLTSRALTLSQIKAETDENEVTG